MKQVLSSYSDARDTDKTCDQSADLFLTSFLKYYVIIFIGNFKNVMYKDNVGWLWRTDRTALECQSVSDTIHQNILKDEKKNME